MTAKEATPGTRLVAVLVYPQVASVDVAGPLEAFGLANFLTGRALYRPVTVSTDGGAVSVAGDFLRIEPTCGCADLDGRIDILLVAGGPGYLAASEDRELIAWLRALEPRCARMGAVCTGSTVLLAAGVMNGHRIATHWLEAIRLSQDEAIRPQVDPDAIYVNVGKFWTSAGIMAGIDLALALIEADHGRQLALDIARFMVLVLRRQGGQSQFSAQLLAETTEDPRIRRVQRHIWENPAGDHSVAGLADRAAMSTRSLARRFKDATGSTLGRYIEDVRLSRARELLETTDLPVQTIAAKAGFGTASSMRRIFQRRLKVAPQTYRESFGEEAGRAHDRQAAPDALRMDMQRMTGGKPPE